MEFLNKSLFTRWFYAINLLFIVINCYLISEGIFFFPILSIVLFVAFAAFFSLDKLVYFIVFFTPLSITYEFSDFAALSLPTEPLLFGVLLIFILGLLSKGGFDRNLYRHWLTKVILLYLAWTTLTIFTSSMPLVSLKYTLARIWFVVCYFFVASKIFQNYKSMRVWIWLFTIPLCIVIIYSIIQFFNYKIDKNALYWVMQPFFKDHTIYGAVIAMILPVMFVFSFDKSYNALYRMTSLFVFTLILVGVILSYTRAAWISLFLAWVIYILFRLHVNWKIIAITSMLGFLTVFSFRNEIMLKIGRNRQDSSKNLQEHLESVSNIRSDVSNLERINRWKSALRMFAERPLFGFGPGTYSFQYAPYQRSYEQTYVSTNAGKLGNAHSEYLSALSETGLPGLIFFLLIIFFTIRSAARVYYKSKSRQVSNLAIGLLTGLCSYFLHGFLNNFLDQDKAALPFWSMIAMIAVLEVYHIHTGQEEVVKVSDGSSESESKVPES